MDYFVPSGQVVLMFVHISFHLHWFLTRAVNRKVPTSIGVAPKMPRKVAFSAKAKKKQLQAKRDEKRDLPFGEKRTVQS